MNMDWSLKELYSSFESTEFARDMEKCVDAVKEIRNWAEENLKDGTQVTKKAEQYISMINDFYLLFLRLYDFAQLVQSADAKNEKAAQVIDRLENIVTELTQPQVAFEKWLGSMENIDEIIEGSTILEDHRYYLEEVKRNSRYTLSESEEVLAAKMKNTGSSAWSKLQEILTSTLLIDINVNGEDKRLPLSAVRNLAYEKDPSTRRKAYEAELAAYDRILDSSAACLNGIKGEVITLCEIRGYESPLQKTLMDCRMDMESLNAMLEAIKESLPAFQRYYRKKAELLGHKNGLPFYDLFAPMGKSDMYFTYDQAREFIVRNFRTFSSKLADYAENAFEKRWIDVMPKEGKRGGAFCANLVSIGESRILTNFTGSFSDVTTLAHELGHGYHGACLTGESYINNNYPMPLAETASIFCETIVKNAALKEAREDEAFAILESDISDAGQVIVDIYSRFLFEDKVFEKRKEGALSVNELKDIMLNAQKEAYGSGLDHQYLHPLMWICKSHYYYADSNYYNFPYAFGLLFAKGIYGEYLKRGAAFVEEYDRLLSVTGKRNIADVASLVGIDIRSADYWRNSLKLIEDDINKFVNMR